MPRKRNWKVSVSKQGVLNPKKKRTDMTGDTGPGISITNPTNSTHIDSDCHTQVAGDTVLLKNSTIESKQLGDTDLHTLINNSTNSCLWAHIESNNSCLRAQRESDNSCLQAHRDLDKSCLQAHSNVDNSCVQAYIGNKNKTELQELEIKLHETEFDLERSNQNIERLKHNTVFASHNQSDLRYSTLSRGNQCTCISLSVILAMQEEFKISTLFLDQVLYEGDNLYKKVVMDLKREGKFINSLLTFDELPTAVEFRNEYFSITKHATIYGLPIVETQSETLSLHEGISFGLSKSEYLLVMYGALCSVVLFIKNQYLFFDSHSHGHDSLSAPDGKSILKIFSSIDDLVAYMYLFYTSCNINLSSQFEILPVTINLLQHEFLQERPSSSDGNQSKLNNLSTASKLNEYNDTKSNKRMEKQRMEQCRDIQSQREMHVKRKLCADVKYREKELLGKRKFCSSDTWKEKELFIKKQSKNNEMFCQKECQEVLGKRKAQKDKQCNQHELHCIKESIKDQKLHEQGKQKGIFDKRKAYMRDYMKRKRNCQDFKEKETLARQKARNDEQYREKELSAKKKKRENEVYRIKELSTKRKEREDEQFRIKELSAKRKDRENEQYRMKELCAKRKEREDEQYKIKELCAKRRKREDEQYKMKELCAKRKERENELYRKMERQKEKYSKKRARSSTIIRLKERLIGLKCKQTARKSKFFVESERLKKQQARKSVRNANKERIADKKRKISNRSSCSFIEKEKQNYHKNKYGLNMKECIDIFHSCTSSGPVYVCTTCHQTWFFDSVCKVENISSVTFKPGILTGLTSEGDEEWICKTCLSNIRKNRVPKLSVLNGMKWPEKPSELNLYPMEERVIALRIPFMQMRELPRGGQFCVKGNVINVPVDIQPTIKALPRQVDDTCTIPVKLKKK